MTRKRLGDGGLLTVCFHIDAHVATYRPDGSHSTSVTP